MYSRPRRPFSVVSKVSNNIILRNRRGVINTLLLEEFRYGWRICTREFDDTPFCDVSVVCGNEASSLYHVFYTARIFRFRLEYEVPIIINKLNGAVMVSLARFIAEKVIRENGIDGFYVFAKNRFRTDFITRIMDEHRLQILASGTRTKAGLLPLVE